MKRFLASKEAALLLILILLGAAVTAKNPLFLGAENLGNTARIVGMYGIFSIGVGFVIITGGIDLSVGSLLALFGVLLASSLTEWRWPFGPAGGHWPAWAAVAGILLLGGLIGSFHGFLVTRVRLQPFIVTLCGLLFYRGLARFLANDETKGFGDAKGFEGLRDLATGTLFGLPTPFVLLLILAAIMGVVLHRSVYGRHLFAAGRNEDAARFSGIETKRVIASAYVISGALAALAGILIAFYTNSVSPSSHGNFFELYAIAAAVLGGCSLRGGEGSIFGIILGTILLQVLRNLVNLLGIPSSLEFAVMGAVILLGVLADNALARRRLKRVAA